MSYLPSKSHPDWVVLVDMSMDGLAPIGTNEKQTPKARIQCIHASVSPIGTPELKFPVDC